MNLLRELLGREESPVPFDSRLFFGKKILVTGAAGSVGFAVVSILRESGAFVTGLDVSEEGIFWGRRSLPTVKWKLGRVSEIQSVREYDVIIHAAAYKHVGILEENKEEGIRNNVGPTANLAGLCWAAERQFVFISTDKAVEASSVMGKTKWIAERCVDAWRHLGLRTTMIRFANVLGSSGSVAPIWEKSDEIVVTSEDMTRWFVTSREAASGILRAMQETGLGNYLFAIHPEEETSIVGMAKAYAAISGKKVRITKPVRGEKTREVFCHENQVLEKLEGFLYVIRRTDVPDSLCEPGRSIPVSAVESAADSFERA